MRWGDARRSDNVEDLRGRGGLRVGGLGVGGTIAVVVVSYFLGVNPLEMLGLVESVAPPMQQQGGQPPASDKAADFIRAILGETEDVWGATFEKSGQSYERPHVVLFSGAVQSGCGFAQSATGPFYCPSRS